MGKAIKKILMIIGGIVVFFILVCIIFFIIVSSTSKKMKCKSSEGDITIMYNKETITGYTAKNINYDLHGQKRIAERIGVDEYLKQFSTWFSTNTTGTCTK